MKGLQSKTTRSYHRTSVKISKIKQRLHKGAKKPDPLYTTGGKGGMWKATATLENHWAFSYKTKHATSNSTPGRLSQRKGIHEHGISLLLCRSFISDKWKLTHTRIRFIHNIQRLETARRSLVSGWWNHQWHICSLEYLLSKKQKLITDTDNTVDEPLENYAECRGPILDVSPLYDSTYIIFWNARLQEWRVE